MFKVWSADRQQRKMVSASSIQELVRKGETKVTAMYGTELMQVTYRICVEKTSIEVYL